ncbi:MAG TPA: thiol reductant ABC exporter subunit CydC [Ktedonobacteraceae bacterium]|jgi:ATP-binding cassette subfamily C protein CydC|nr:thiol reductant ABC exporter subunit CydC [Ktedonobacteraceae bacterium]
MKSLLRLLQFLAPFRWQIVLAVILGCTMVASSIILLSMAAYLIAAAALAPLLLLLTFPIYIVRFMGVLRPVSRYSERLVSHELTFRLLTKIRTWVFQHLEPLAPAHLLTYRSGDILSRLIADVNELQNLYLRIVSLMLIAILMSIFTLVVFLVFSSILTWVAFGFLLVTGLGVPLLSLCLSRELGKRQLALRAEQKAHIVDGIQGIQDMLIYDQKHTQQQKITHLDTMLGNIQRRLAYITSTQEALNDFMANIAMFCILILAIALINNGSISAVYLGFLALLMLGSFEAIQPLGQAFQFLGHSVAAGNRLFHITDASPTVIECPDPRALPQEREYAITFDHISFAYNAEDVIKDVNLQLRPGTCTAIVGPSGAGKSTLARLLLRYWDPASGLIYLNAQDIRQYKLADLRSLIGVVAQDTYLFNNTLRGNLLLARTEASDDELMQVLAQAQLGDFVRQLPQGLETWIGEQGLRLSGGERQRLAIARALLKNAPILLLDEATANLDRLTEQALMDALFMLMQGRTTLVITHRLIAMERMDEIIVLQQGTIQEHGIHAHLLAQKGLYHQMYASQNAILTLPASEGR